MTLLPPEAGLACYRPATRRRPASGVTQQRRGSYTQSRIALRAPRDGAPGVKEVMSMEVLIGVDPHKATNVVAAVDEQGEAGRAGDLPG